MTTVKASQLVHAVLQTARLRGASRIVAVDIDPAKRDVAARFGAHDFVIAEPSETGEALAARVNAVIGVPVDVAVECSGAPAAIAAAVACTAWGGTRALVAHVLDGGLALDAQVSGVWPLRHINEALAAVREGSVVRAVVTHGGEPGR
jgi:S-(hydroxymethyl)glutathione dehydrogenase/alcohol dehydrogenase